MKSLLTLASVALMAATLTACGDSAGDAYCDELKSAQSTFKDFNSGDAAELEQAFAEFEKLGKQAPDEIADDWKTLNGGIANLQKSLDDAGLKLSDLEKLQGNDLPKGLDADKLKPVIASFTELGSQKFTQAGDAIKKQAQDSCKIEL